jgi:arsenate reductase-like glutaredoxin family protein
MKKVDWSYHRPGCKTCGKTQDYFQTAGTQVKLEVNATKEKYDQGRALQLLRESATLLVAKGQKFQEINLKKTELSDDELLKLVMGPTGNLRAPTFKVGKTLVVGFNEEMYQKLA